MKVFRILLAMTALVGTADACTSILVSRGASKDGSVFITYSADGPFMPRLVYLPAGDHKPGTMVDAKGWEDPNFHGQVKQVAHTYAVVGLMNEHQLAIGETTTGGREELTDPKGILDYDALITLALQRARTAKEAIRVIDELANEYGYNAPGETFSIADKDETWMMEIIGKGTKEKGAVWVAARVPEGHITAHANISRITTFPLDDKENWLYAPDVVTFAVEQGFYKTDTGKPFSYRDAYHPGINVSNKRACAGRVWSIYRRVAPSLELSDAFFRGLPSAEDYPLFIKPDAKLSLGDVMGLMRDHYEGTPYDMTKGVDAGPFGSPYRFRDLAWKVDGVSCSWERPISTQQAGFVMVAQSRKWLPDPVGGVYWFTPDDAYTSCFTPLYCGIDALPEPYLKGDHNRFSWDSAWWVYNMVSNLTYDRWSRIIPDVQAVQREREDALLKMQPVIDETAVKLGQADPTLMRTFLTDYSVSTAEGLFRRWRELAELVLTRHNDGYINDRTGAPKAVGYPPEWLRKVFSERPKQFRVDEPTNPKDKGDR